MIDRSTIVGSPEFYRHRAQGFVLIRRAEELAAECLSLFRWACISHPQFSDLEQAIVEVESHRAASEILAAQGRSDFRRRMYLEILPLQMPTVFRAVEGYLASLMTRAPHGSSDWLLSQSDQMRTQASLEASWDNYCTAAQLRRDAAVCDIAAYLNSPGNPSTGAILAYSSQCRRWFNEVISCVNSPPVACDWDDEHSQVRHATLVSMWYSLPIETVSVLVDEVSRSGLLGGYYDEVDEVEEVEPGCFFTHRVRVWCHVDPELIKVVHRSDPRRSELSAAA